MMKAVLRNRFGGILATMVFLTSTTGCSRGTGTGTISGNVTFQDAPIPIGMIAFISQSGKVASANIAKGVYTVTGVEVGPDATVTVTSHPPSPMMQPPTGQVDGVPVYPPGQYVRIPDRYGDSKRSDLTCEVIEGTQTCDFDLQP